MPTLNVPIDNDIQRYSDVFSFPGDKTYATYELSELQRLPKSLFYDAATADGAYSGLFAYYILGKGKREGVKYDISETKQELEKITPKESRNPSARMIIDTTSKITGVKGEPAYLDPTSPYRGQIYNVKDFIFCKHYGIIPNNRMLTLRRFPYPTLDSLRTLPNESIEFTLKDSKVSTKKETVELLDRVRDANASENSTLPVCQAVTYFGEGTGNNLSTILSISTGLKFEYETQEKLKDQKTGDPGLMNSPFGDLIKSFIQSGNSNLDVESLDNLFGTLTAPELNEKRLKRFLLDAATTEDGPLSKKFFVNVNTVNQMMVRKLGFSGGTDSFTINFEYNLTSVGTINTKLLFLDLMTNLLSLGADYGQFLSPELRLQQTNVGIGFPGGAAGYAKAIVDPLGYVKDRVSGMLSSDNINRIRTAEKKVSEEIEKAMEEAKAYANNSEKNEIPKDGHFFRALSIMISEQFMKKIYFQPIMLSGYPTGDWHLVVGNPLNPIAMVGNLVCTNVKITLNDDLGPDDFPTEIKASFTLSPGRQRHRGDWESMFNRGNGRLYLGQLATSGESTNAFQNTFGFKVLQSKNLEETITKNAGIESEYDQKK